MSFPAPDGYYPTKDEMADYLEAYADRFDLPITLDTSVDSLSRNGERYTLNTDSQRFRAEHVIVAAGPFHHPNIPEFADELDPTITSFHSSEYRNPDQLPDVVLVVGAGNSGAEIAREVATTGRNTFLSGRDTGSIPLRLFNTKAFWWLFGSVLTVDTWVGRTFKERNQGRGDPLIRLTKTDLQQAGLTRVPRTDGVVDGTPYVDDGRVLDVDAVVWATGYRPDYSWIEVPGVSFDANGYPVHTRGVVAGAPGLYFLGLPYQSTLVSDTIGGVCPDARSIADNLQSETEHGPLRDREHRNSDACPTDIRSLLGL